MVNCTFLTVLKITQMLYPSTKVPDESVADLSFHGTRKEMLKSLNFIPPLKTSAIMVKEVTRSEV